MNEGQINGRLGWLSANLAAQRNTITSILLRLRGVVLRAGTSLALHKKFMSLMNQVADDREKELDIIHEIEAVEKRHGELRRLRLLRKPSREDDPDTRTNPDFIPPERYGEKPRRFSWLKLLGIYMLFSSNNDAPKVQPKSQGPAPD